VFYYHLYFLIAQYLAIQPSRLQGCSNKISCQRTAICATKISKDENHAENEWIIEATRKEIRKKDIF